MRRIMAAVFVASLAGLPLAAQESPIVGSWSGELQVPGARLPLVMHIRSEGGELRATMDSPAQGAMGIPVDSARFVDNELTLRLVALNGTYRGRLEGDVLRGEWQQGPSALPLELRRSTGTVSGPARPQLPTPPFPYRVEEVRFRNEAAGVELAGTLTLPQGQGPFPGAVLVSGSGPQDRDETLLGHKPFLVLADYLTRAGIAVLRYDDRGVGGSTGDFAAATSVDFAGDAAAAVAFLQAHGAVAGDRVGIIGHSEGGLIAPLVATGAHGARRGDVAYLVLLAGPALPGGEILSLQSEAIGRASGIPAEMEAVQRRFQVAMQATVREEADPARRRERLREVLRTTLEEIPPETRAAQGIPQGQEAQWIDAQVNQVGTEWFRQFVMMDPRPTLQQVRVPVLALFGEKDLQVPPRENAPAMRAALAANPDATVVEMPGLNHLFQHATTGAPGEYMQIEETFAPVALERVAGWIHQRFGPGAGRD